MKEPCSVSPWRSRRSGPGAGSGARGPRGPTSLGPLTVTLAQRQAQPQACSHCVKYDDSKTQTAGSVSTYFTQATLYTAELRQQEVSQSALTLHTTYGVRDILNTVMWFSLAEATDSVCVCVFVCCFIAVISSDTFGVWCGAGLLELWDKDSLPQANSIIHIILNFVWTDQQTDTEED